ncbi:hypothetical protein BHM03_00048580 [Ensete ventricosum]|nr:hypothetical protein BHM03_00048580 [Ensete ventricosum]
MSQDPAESLTEWDKIGVRSGLLRDSSVADPDHGSGADSEAVERSRQPFVVPGIRGSRSMFHCLWEAKHYYARLGQNDLFNDPFFFEFFLGSFTQGEGWALKALGIMKSCHDFNSVVTEGSLITIWVRYSIPDEYAIHALLFEQCPYDLYPNGFSVFIDALKAGLRFSLHLVIEECLG